MTLEKSCNYYLNTRCILTGGFCDLNCNQLLSDEDFKFYDKIDILTQWQMEEEMRQEIE